MAGLSVSGRFGLLIAAQAVHSIEEYLTRLYDVLVPAGLVSDALGIDRPSGFIASNVLLGLFGLWCWLARVRPRRGAWRGLAWFWALLEGANGAAHLALAVAAGGYFPGLATAPPLLALSVALALRLRAG